MSAGIKRVHGSLIAPKNFAGVTLQDFTLTFWAGDLAALAHDIGDGKSVADGALDKVFRTAVSQFASLSRVGTVDTSTGEVRFAIEALGASEGSEGFLGMGPGNGEGVGEAASTAAALEAAVQALGVVTFTIPGSTATTTITLSSATVDAFVY